MSTVNSSISAYNTANHKLYIAETYSGFCAAIDETYDPATYPIWYRAKRIFKRNTPPVSNVHGGTKEGYLSWYHRMQITSTNLNIGTFSNGNPNFIQYTYDRVPVSTTDFSTTFNYNCSVGTIQWSISRTDLLDIVLVKDIDSSITDPNYKGIVLKDSVTNITSGSSLGNLIATLTVNGITSTETIPLIAGQTYPVPLTGSQPITYSEDDPSGGMSALNTKFYSIDNNAWTSLDGLGTPKVNVGQTIKFKGIFSGSGTWNYYISSTDHPGLNTQKLNDTLGETLITPNVTVTGPVSVVFKAVKL